MHDDGALKNSPDALFLTSSSSNHPFDIASVVRICSGDNVCHRNVH